MISVRLVLIAMSLGWCVQLLAGTEDRNASLQSLANDPQWLKLLHYETGNLPGASARSAIKSPEFFLSPSGHDSPLAELTATVTALQMQPKGPDTHASCRFPARTRWLQQRLGSALTVPSGVQCPALEQWTRDNTVESVSIIYATGYLANPASYYGHTLLKFNFKDSEAHSDLMDESVNYGAIVGDGDDPVSYIFKGIFGGYDGGFSHINFYFHNHNYGENELRDLWEYQLTLSEDATQMVVEHAWEVLGKRYTYYFFRRNCAFRMAELVDISSDTPLLQQWRPWTIPQSLVQSLSTAEIDGQPVLTDVRYLPSRQSRLYDRYQQLSPSEQQLFERIAIESVSLEDPRFTGQPIDVQHRVLDTLLDYYQYIRDAEAGAEDPANAAHRRALAMRYQLPPGNAEFKPSDHTPPHLGRPPGWFQLSLQHSTRQDAQAGIRVRPAYYDPLDNEAGHVRGGGLSMFDLQLTASNGQVRLQQLDAISIESISPGLTGLPGDKGVAWNLKFGWEQNRLDCNSCLTTRLQADRGLNFPLGNNTAATFYAGGALQESVQGEGPAFGRLAGRLTYHRASFSALLRLEQRYLVNGSGDYTTGRLELRNRLSATQDVRLSYARNRGEELSIGLGWYW